jgi:hypothetical protein
MGVGAPIIASCLGFHFKGHKLALVFVLGGENFGNKGQNGLEGGDMPYRALESSLLELMDGGRGFNRLLGGLVGLDVDFPDNGAKGGLGVLVGQNFSTCSTYCYKFIMQYAASWPCRELL